VDPGPDQADQGDQRQFRAASQLSFHAGFPPLLPGVKCRRGAFWISRTSPRRTGLVVVAGGEQLAPFGIRLTVDDGGKWSVFSNEHQRDYRCQVVARPADSLQGHLDKLPGAVDDLD
jgi:hypothetical protein